MPAENQNDYQEILNQIHSDVFLERLRNHMDPDGRSKMSENDAAKLNDLVRRLLVQDTSPPIDSENIQKLLEDEEFRNYLSRSINTFIKYQSKKT